MLPKVAIIDLGSQTTLLIERTLREIGFRSVILNPKQAQDWFEKNPVNAVILSGGSASVYQENAPQPPEMIFSLKREDGRPVEILGICYGMQWLVQHLGGEVKPGGREYGRVRINRGPGIQGALLAGTPTEQDVWMNHGDSVTNLPDGLSNIAYSGSGIGSETKIAAMQGGNISGALFHPEVTHTKHGQQILLNFLRSAKCRQDWVGSSIARSIQDNIAESVQGRRAIIGFSGGVDSTTLAALAAPVLKDKLLAVTIDGDNLRKNEVYEICTHAGTVKVGLHIEDARDLFQAAFTGITDAEFKRRQFKDVYREVLMTVAKRFDVQVILQGTLAPDRIESGTTGGVNIKSHHNVGLDMGDLIQIHPIDHLFKYEVRDLAQKINLPKSIWNRQPFPGPGLFIRVVGVVPTPDKLEIVRWADHVVKEILVKNGFYDEISQLVVAYLGLQTVGVKGDARVYGGAIGIRAVRTLDFMTAEGVWFPESVVSELKSALTAHPEVVRVWFDPTDKPCATTEFE